MGVVSAKLLIPNPQFCPQIYCCQIYLTQARNCFPRKFCIGAYQINVFVVLDLAIWQKIPYANKRRWGMNDYIEKYHQVTNIPTMRYIQISCARMHMCEENIGTRMYKSYIKFTWEWRIQNIPLKYKDLYQKC